MFQFSLYITVFIIINFHVNAGVFSQSLVEVDEHDFSTHILEHSNVFIVALKDRLTSNEDDDLTSSVKGLIDVAMMTTVAMVNALNDQEAFVGEIANTMRFIVFPYGIRNHKLRKWQGYSSVAEARKSAFSILPDRTVTLNSEMTDNTNELKGYLEQALQHFPPRFPVVLFTDKSSTSALYKALTLQLSTLFHFAVMRNPSPAAMTLYGVRTFPHLAILLVEIQKDGTPTLRTVGYDAEKNGRLSYASILRFLYLSHKKFFKQLPRSDDAIKADAIDIDEVFEKRIAPFHDELMASTPGLNGQSSFGSDSDSNEIPLESSTVEWATDDDYKLCQFQKADVCLFILRPKSYKPVVTDGSVNTIPNDLRIVIATIRNLNQNVLAFSLIGKCYSSLLDEFNLSEEDMPAILLVHAKKRLFTISASIPSDSEAASFFKLTMTGNLPQRKYTKLPYLRRSAECNKRETDTKKKSEL